jgi:hypothetical protein
VTRCIQATPEEFMIYCSRRVALLRAISRAYQQAAGEGIFEIQDVLDILNSGPEQVEAILAAEIRDLEHYTRRATGFDENEDEE